MPYPPFKRGNIFLILLLGEEIFFWKYCSPFWKEACPAKFMPLAVRGEDHEVVEDFLVYDV